jgi:PKD repeat protein
MYASPVTVSLAAADTGGSGVASTHYTTDGSAPTLASSTYTAPFTVPVTSTVSYRSWDTTGNAEATKSLTISVNNQAPVAALAVTPSSGVAPFAMTADASGSTDNDTTPISSYTFNFGDGTASVTQAGATATHTYTTVGTFTVTVTARDTTGLTGSTTKQMVSKQNLVVNSGFESNTFVGNQQLGGVANPSLRRPFWWFFGSGLRNTGATAATCILDDSPNFVNKTSAGTYTATLWVRGGTSGAVMNLRLQEMNGTTIVRSATNNSVTLSATWQQVTVSLTVAQPGVTTELQCLRHECSGSPPRSSRMTRLLHSLSACGRFGVRTAVRRCRIAAG